MKKLLIIFLITMFVLANVPAFAKTWKIEEPEDSPFNALKNWFSHFGKTPGGVEIMDIKKKESWYSEDEIKERRKSIGVKRGMKCYE